MISNELPTRICHNRGATDFKNAVENYVPVIDKSLLIKTIIDNRSKFKMLSFPSGSGKTFNLSMLKYFFEISEHDQRYLFKNFAIWQEDKHYWQHFGKYPVIFFSLNDLIHKNYQNRYKEFVADLYQKYKAVLIAKNVLDKDDMTRYQAIIDKKADDMRVKYALKTLIQLLSSAYRTRVILLVDAGKLGFHMTGEIENYFANILGPLKDDAHLHQAIATSVLPLRGKNCTYLPYDYRTVLRPNSYTPFYGFSENETQHLLKLSMAHSLFDKLAEAQGGYIGNNNKKILNPRLIMTYLAARHQLYLALENKSNPLPSDLNKIIVDYATEFTELSDAQLMSLVLIHNTEVVKTNIYHLLQNKSIIREIDEVQENDQDVWRLLVFCGYLIGKKIRPVIKPESSYSDYFLLSIPNKTAFQFFKSVSQHWEEKTTPKTPRVRSP